MKAERTDTQKTLLEHLDELRVRLLKCAGVFILTSLGSYFFSENLISFLTRNIRSLVFIEPFEAFTVRIKAACFSGFLISLPIILYQIWAYVGIIFEKKQRRLILIFLPVSILLFVAGMSFALIVMIPVATKFLLSFSTPKLVPMITVNAYLSFEIMLMMVFGIFFEIPVILLTLVHFGLLTTKAIAAQRRYYIVGIFIVAAVLTPGPDVVSQLLLAIPGLLLFEAGLLMTRVIYRR